MHIVQNLYKLWAQNVSNLRKQNFKANCILPTLLLHYIYLSGQNTLLKRPSETT